MKTPIIATIMVALTAGAAAGHTVIKNDLRAPAYPLVTIDPYTSAWSAADNLYDAPVTHWTAKDFPFIGVVKVDGTPYRFMGIEQQEMNAIVPTSEQGDWTGRWTTETPVAGWNTPDFNDSAWKSDRGAFGTQENEPTARTQWGTRNIWVRRTVQINPADIAGRQVYLEFSNDDDAVFYINGVKIFSTGSTCNKNKVVKLDDEAMAAIKPGKNLIAAECINPVGNGLLDFGLSVPRDLHTVFEKTATQTSADVQATQTHYTFTCGPVDLALHFSAPVFLDNRDYDLLSRPVNYVTYDARTRDGRKHNIEFYFEASPRWALDQPNQQSHTSAYEKNGIAYLKSGSTEQAVLAKWGDHVRIDWGYFYMAAPKAGIEYGVGSSSDLRNSFAAGKSVGAQTSGDNADGQMALVRNFGKVKNAKGMLMIGYDDMFSIQYFGQNLRPYWNRKGNKTIESQFEAAASQYSALIDSCYAFDLRLMQEARAGGGKEYAELCALAYRQAIAAHKLVESPKGELLWFSKENDSNGSIGTVDITYPSAPLFLYYNTDLAKGLLNHNFEYSESGRWTKNFPAHDVGTYPRANGQTYGGDMPIEEGGNMLIVTAAICDRDGNADYAAAHWPTLTIWTDYLVQYGLDPENQLCTDDFAGHFAHNVNLSAKAIEGIAAYAYMAGMLGKDAVAQKYMDIARNYAAKWKTMATDGDHYRLTFDKPGTWSQKYNIVWDKLLGFNVFDPEIMNTEIKYYLTRQNQYGLPLDNRETYTKTDWIMWTATMTDNQADFDSFVKPVHKFFNETVDRVPMSDWVFTDKPNRRGFMTRAVVGGYFIKMLDKQRNKK